MTKFSDFTFTGKDIIVLIGLVLPAFFFFVDLKSDQEKIMDQQKLIIQTIGEEKSKSSRMEEKIHGLDKQINLVRHDVDNVLNGKILFIR